MAESVFIIERWTLAFVFFPVTRLGSNETGMDLMRDLQSHRWMWVKAALFLVIGLTSSALILWELPELRILALLVLAIWAFCRAYYFAFYVIEHYIDPSFRFSGLWSALRHLLKKKSAKQDTR